MKPFKCKECPRFRNNFVTPVGTTPAKIAFILEEPPFWGGVAMAGNDGKMLKAVLARCSSKDSLGIVPSIVNKAFYMYAVSCGDRETKASVKLIEQCKGNVGAQNLLNSGATVVVAMGAKAMSFMGIKGLYKHSRGSVKEVTFFGKQMQVLTTFSMANLMKTPGVADIVTKDILTACKLVVGKKLDDIDVPKLLSNYDIPDNIDAAIEVAKEYSQYCAEGKTIENSMMALDFETTTLFGWNTKGRVIAISGAVAPGKAFSLYVDHKDSPYSFEKIIPWVWKILQSPHPKTWWNYKYDYGIAKHILTRQTREAIAKNPVLKSNIEWTVGRPLEEILNTPVYNTRWDGMLAEHMLDEDKKGHYSLKEVILTEFPSLAGYEKPLHDQLSSIEEDIRATKLNLALTSTLKDLQQSPLGGNKGLLEELEDLDKFIKILKTKKRSQKDKAKKQAISDTISMLENRKKYLKKVKASVTKYLNKEADHISSSKKVDPAREEVTFEMVDVGIMMPYAAIDADLTYRLSMKQRLEAWKQDTTSMAKADSREPMISLMDKHYIPITECLSDMQVEGVRIDAEYLLSQSKILFKKEVQAQYDLVHQISTDLGRDPSSVILNNPSSLADILVTGYGLPKIKETASGAISSASDVMEEWGKTHSIAKDILDFRAVSKARSTYLSSILELSSFDSRVHGNINANGTATGRLSSSNPNLQNIPPVLAGVPIKKAFIPTDTSSKASPADKLLCTKYGWSVGEEMCVVDLDFAGAEVRGLTVYARDPDLLHALNTGLDMHSWVASMVFQEDYEAINTSRKKENAEKNAEDKRLTTLRQQAKSIVFGIIFCIGPGKLSEQLNITPQEATALMNLFFKRFPLVEKYINTTKRAVVNKGILRTPTGRARRFPLVHVGGSVAAACQRQGVNYLVQGFTSEIVTRTLINIHRTIRKIRGRLLLTVHDSLVFEMPAIELPNLESYLEQEVRDFIKKEFPMVPVALPYDVEVGPSYGEAKYSIESYTQKLGI